MTGGVTIELLDGTKIPWLGWGNGSGKARKTAVESGNIALASGIRHIDTAQGYKNEEATGQVIAASGLPSESIFVTSKLSPNSDDSKIPLSEVRATVEETTRKIGRIPDLFLIHSPFTPENDDVAGMWKILEELKDEGKLKSIGVSNFRLQDYEKIFASSPKYIPTVNQIEYHPFVLTHLAPVLELQAKHGIVTQSYGPLTTLVRHPTKGGPLFPVLERIAARISSVAGKPLDAAAVLLLWTRAQGVVAVSASGTEANIKKLGEAAELPDLLEQSEIDEITAIGKQHHFRHYTEHMERDFPVPALPSGA